MSTKMKILISYDGSEGAGAMLNDLTLAGLPREAEAKVISIGEISMLPEPSYATGGKDYSAIPETDFSEILPLDLKGARLLASRASKRIKSYFPAWEVSSEASTGWPATEIIKKANEWKPDLIVVGSYGRSALGRFIFGSVSQKIVTEANCSVRVGREHEREGEHPVRIVIGVDGSRSADAAVRAVAARVWPAGSEVLLISSIGSFSLANVGANLISRRVQEESIYANIHKALEIKLNAAGLAISSVVKAGDPKRVILNEAEQWGADCIFVGSRGLNRLGRFLLGSVSTAVVVNARCSVEVVR